MCGVRMCMYLILYFIEICGDVYLHESGIGEFESVIIVKKVLKNLPNCNKSFF